MSIGPANLLDTFLTGDRLVHSSQTDTNEPDNGQSENPCVFTVESRPEQEAGQETDEHPPAKEESTPADKSHTKDDTEDDTTDNRDDTTEVMDDSKPSQPRKKFRSSDPLTWYGILVPPSLRSAQKSFTEAIEKQVPALASVVAEMQAVEKEVDRARGRDS